MPLRLAVGDKISEGLEKPCVGRTSRIERRHGERPVLCVRGLTRTTFRPEWEFAEASSLARDQVDVVVKIFWKSHSRNPAVETESAKNHHSNHVHLMKSNAIHPKEPRSNWRRTNLRRSARSHGPRQRHKAKEMNMLPLMTDHTTARRFQLTCSVHTSSIPGDHRVHTAPVRARCASG